MRKWLFGVLLALLLLASGSVYVYENLWNDYSSLNHYEALGVSPTASALEIKRAFRELSLRYHPDKASSELNTRRFHRISSAAQVLSDEETRHAYDIQLKEDQRMRAYQQDLAWKRVRVLPASRNIGDIVSFYLTEFPWHVLGLLLQLLDLGLFFKLLVVLGCVIFVFDLVSRFFGGILGRFQPVQVSVAKEIKDKSLRAARERQQQCMVEQAALAQAQLRKRKAERRVQIEAAISQ